MKDTVTLKRRFLGLFPCKTEVPKPRIYHTSEGLVPCWVCTNGNGFPGFGGTPRRAWEDWKQWIYFGI